MELSLSRSAGPGGVVRSAPLGQNIHESTAAGFWFRLWNYHLLRNENTARTRTKIEKKNQKHNKCPDPKSQKVFCWQHVPAIYFYIRRLLWITHVHFRCSRILHARTDNGKAHQRGRECRSGLVSHARRFHIMMSLRQWLGTTKTYWLSAESSVALRGPFVWLQLGFTHRILCWRDAICLLKFVTMLQCVGEPNRKWQKQNLGGRAVTHRRLAAAERVRVGLDFIAFHTSALSSADQVLSASFGRSFPIQSDQHNSQIWSLCTSEIPSIYQVSECAVKAEETWGHLYQVNSLIVVNIMRKENFFIWNEIACVLLVKWATKLLSLWQELHSSDEHAHWCISLR